MMVTHTFSCLTLLLAGLGSATMSFVILLDSFNQLLKCALEKS